MHMEFDPPLWTAFPIVQRAGGGGGKGRLESRPSGPQLSQSFAGKNERDARNETKPMAYIWNTLGLLLTFEVRSTISNSNGFLG